MTVSERMQELDKDVNVRVASGFGNELPLPFTPAAKLEVGDQLIFPSSYEGKIRERQLNGKWYPFAVVDLKKADGTMTTYDFFPTRYVRPIYEYKVDGGSVKFVGVRPHKGTSIQHMMSFIGSADKDAQGNITLSSTQKMMNSLLGTKHEVKAITAITSAKFVNGKRSETEVEEQNLLTVDTVA
jgi:hypothetical protein